MTSVPLKATEQWNQAASSLEILALLNGYHNQVVTLSCRHMNFLGVSTLPELLGRLLELIHTWLCIAYNCDFKKSL